MQTTARFTAIVLCSICTFAFCVGTTTAVTARENQGAGQLLAKVDLASLDQGIYSDLNPGGAGDLSGTKGDGGGFPDVGEPRPAVGRAALNRQLEQVSADMARAKAGEKVWWPIFAVFTPIGAALTAVAAYYDVMGVAGVAEGCGAVMGLGIGGLIVGSIDSAHYRKYRKEQRRIYRELGIDPEGGHPEGSGNAAGLPW